MTSPRNSSKGGKSKRPPATTPEARENQLISLAVDLAEKQLRDGSAPAMVTTHYLKLATTKSRLEVEKLKRENKLLEARASAIESTKLVEELYKEALAAMRTYQGHDDGGGDED